MTEDATLEVDLDGARRLVAEKGSKLIWLGGRPRIDIAEALGIEGCSVEMIGPDEVYHCDGELAERLSGSVLVCPHGNTSLFLAQHLRENFGVEAYSLRGGISAVVGENSY